MPTLTIKGLPDEVYARLKARAAEHRRSLNREIIVCLERALAEGERPRIPLAAADALRKRLALPPLTERQLRAAKTVGRP